jgi:hypothetical protein
MSLHRAASLTCYLLFLAQLVAFSGQAPKQDRSWKAYANTQWGYCVSYPSRWLKGDAFDGAGIFVATGEKRFSRPLGEIDVGALPASRPQDSSLTLIEDRDAHLEVLKKFERAESLEILEQREMQVAGAAALFIKDRYYDPQERAAWIDEIIFTERKGTLYRLELECRADQVDRFEPVFQMFVGTFRFDCERGP